MRKRMRDEKLGGYDIPEVDYDSEMMFSELKECGGTDIAVLPHNLFGYLLALKSQGLAGLARRLYYYAWQIVPPSSVPEGFAFRHAGTLIGMARKPNRK